MPKPNYEPLAEQLVALRQRLRGDIRSLGQAALSTEPTSGNPATGVRNHPADAGSDTYEQEFDLLLMENDEETLSQVEAALERFRQGQYGTCVSCGKRIRKLRLEAIPFTPHCIDCASKLSSKSH
ncbi:MAG: TraR/DksA C4-type zinc finger protein [Pirellulaceae bacterium]